jgi:hypothetical protein
MSGRRLALVVLAALVAPPLSPAHAQAPEREPEIEMEPDAPAPDDDEPPPVVKDPKLARKLVSTAAQLVQKGDYLTRRNKPDEANAHYDNAVLAYQKAIEVGDDLNVHFELAVVEEKRGKIDVAARHLRIVVGAQAGVRQDVLKKAQLKLGFPSMGYIFRAFAMFTSNRSDGRSPTVSIWYMLRYGTCTRYPFDATKGSCPSIVKRICPS